MVRLKSVGVLSAAKIASLLYAGISLLIIPILLIMAAVMSAMPHQPNQPPAIIFVVFAFIAPFFYAAIGFLVGALGAFVYNLAAGWLGGLEMEFVTVLSPQTQLPQTGPPSV